MGLKRRPGALYAIERLTWAEHRSLGSTVLKRFVSGARLLVAPKILPPLRAKESARRARLQPCHEPLHP